MRLPTSNVFWSGLEAAAASGLSFAAAFVVARIVGPAELGVGAAVVAINVLLCVVVNALFADALVQRPGLTAEEASSGLWAGLAAGALGALIQIALAWPLGLAIADPRISPMCLLLALPLPLVGTAGAVQGLLTRDRQYRRLAGRTLFGQGGGTLVGILLAGHGAGAWALVCQQATTSLLGALVLLLGTEFRPRPICRWRDVRALLAIGLPLTAGTLVQQGRYRAFAVLIGSLAGPAVLGQVHMAFRLVDTVRDLAINALWRLLLPTMSERQADRPALRASIERSLAL